MITLIRTKIVLDHLKLLSEAYFKTDDVHKASIFSAASTTIGTKYPETLPLPLQDILQLRGIGPSTFRECESVILTGTSKRLQDLQLIMSVYEKPSEETTKSLDLIKSLLKQS